MKLRDPLFYAKILLFGEYSIIENSMGLSIPYNYYQGSFKNGSMDDQTHRKSNENLKKYANHLIDLRNSGELNCELDLERFSQDIDQGLYFDSTIPQGFGVGSSGALVAAIYSTYAINGISSGDDLKKENIAELKVIFGQLESYFHGKSSGIDPLICYLNIPLLIKSKSEIDAVGIPDTVRGNGAIFLIDTGSPGETQPMVNIFMEKCKQEGFRKMLKEQFVAYNDECIQSFLKSDIKGLFSNLKNLSNFLLEHFKPMIPAVFHKLWKQGLESNDYYLKLCGSGGGGFILGFAEDFNRAENALKGYELEVIHRF